MVLMERTQDINKLLVLMVNLQMTEQDANPLSQKFIIRQFFNQLFKSTPSFFLKGWRKNKPAPNGEGYNNTLLYKCCGIGFLLANRAFFKAVSPKTV
jgi:hypothetical protein